MVTRSSSVKALADSKKATVAALNSAANVAANAPKVDKPRPHRCQTCDRSFARLEHLKRHERSHTKEKPFMCPECRRCFARRDLLLRHQQKLHANMPSSARSRIRRESTSGATTVAANRARKNSVATPAHSSSISGPMRPRANTISHVDAQAAAQIVANNVQASRSGPGGHVSHPSLSGLPHSTMNHHSHVYSGMQAALNQRGMSHELPKLNTHSLHHSSILDFPLRTAPAMHNLFDLDLNNVVYSASTINPNALHYNDSPQSMALDAMSPFGNHSMGEFSNQTFEDALEWMTGGFDSHVSISAQENHIEGSSPSAISSTSQQSGVSDVMLDGGHQQPGNTPMWSAANMMGSHMGNPFSMDMGPSSFSDMISTPMSPHNDLQGNEPFTPPSSLGSIDPSVYSRLNHLNFDQVPA